MREKIFKNRLLTVVFFIIPLLFVPSVFAASETIYASYKYTMGDNDTKNDAKRICFIEAKRLAIEKAGTFIESSTEVKNFQLTRDEIRTYAGAIIKVDIASEDVKFIGESPTIFMTVKAEVDINSFQERVKQIKGDRELERKIREQQEQIQAMENKIKGLQKQLTTKDFNEILKARRERSDTFEALDEIEKIKYEIKTKTKSAIEKIELGMTPQEVIRVAGQPRSKDFDNLNYGNVWVIFEGGIVSCIIRAEAYFWARRCESYRGDYRKSVLK